MTIAYHATRPEKVGAIKRWGLIPRDTSKHNYPGIQHNMGVEAVYVWTDWNGADWWTQGRYRSENVVLMLDIDGLRTERDAYYEGHPALVEAQSATRVLDRIGPERIIGRVVR